METKRFELEGSDWVEFYVEMKHKTHKAIADLSRQYLTFPGGDSKITVTQGSDGELKTVKNAREIEIDIGRMDFTAQNEALILNQVESWSYGEVTTAVLGELSEKEFDQLKDIANRLYTKLPLQESVGKN